LGVFARPNHSGGGGNGGDFVRMKFMEVGNFVLKNYKDGLREIETLASIDDLRKTLDIRVIKLAANPLVDNGGSKVDAIGTPGSIILFEGNLNEGTGWYGIFSKADLVEKLVLHEMLRAAGVNDDNYIYSSKVLKSFDLSTFDTAAYIRWCSESASFIESALKQGIFSKTYAEQRTIYVNALAQVEALISPKHFYFIAPSVVGAKKIASLLKSDKNKVHFLRIALKQMANDIRYVDSQLKTKKSESTNKLGDHAKYASSYIRSASHFTVFSETKDIELQMLDIVFDQVYAYMVNSDYARVKYGAVFSELDSARNTPVLSYKRSALDYLEKLLK
jgi:hypothetical protein